MSTDLPPIEALERLNALRSAMVHTQSATWSNLSYPLVAILNAAGFPLLDMTDAECALHLRAYGGAGNMPQPKSGPPYEGSLTTDIRDRRERMMKEAPDA